MCDPIRRKIARRSRLRLLSAGAASAIAAVFAAGLALAPAGQAQTWRQSAPAPLLSFHGYETAAQGRVVVPPPSQVPARTLVPQPSPTIPAAQPARPVDLRPADLAAQALSGYAAGFASDPDPLVSLTAELYRQARFRPLWFRDTGWTDLGHGAADLLRRSVNDGLPSEVYQMRMEQGLRRGAGAAEVAQVDFTLTLGLLRLARDLRLGLRSESVPGDLTQTFKAAYGARDLAGWLDAFRPQTPLYRALRAELAARRLTPFQVPKAALALHRERTPLLIHPEHHVVVDIGLQRLRVYENRRLSFELPVVVGTPERRTPIMIDSIVDLKFSPEWILPPTVVREDVFPLLYQDPQAVEDMGIQTLDPNGRRIPATAVNWSAFDPGALPFQFRMEPGHPNNQLGGVRFSLTNDQAIFLHDSPDSDRYGDGIRSLSSGCVRVGHAHLLALWIMARQKGWTPADVDYAMQSGQTRTERLPRPIPVNLVYSTVGLNEYGALYFKPDIYGEDAQLARFLGLNLL